MSAEVGDEEHFESAITKLIASGAGATGAAAGGVAGFLLGGPGGAVAGGVTGALLQDGMKAAVGELAERLTTRTERERVGSCLVLAHKLIVERLNAGQPLREPSFFKRRERKAQQELRSEAEELLEGTFLAARDAYEERKVEMLARFYANAAFERNVDSSHLNHILNLAKLLTYRQLVTIGIIGSHDLTSVRASDFRGSGSLPNATIGVLYEMFQMIGLDLVVSKDSSYMMGVGDINPSLLRLQGNGAHLFNLLRPDNVSSDDQQFFYSAFPL
ncbi:hypothetical protein BKG77_06745 [Mycobacteroides chelonae]|uniref:hypothetical protein n=1 Tax=Mycobacteroides chelonae TaxID=1774 RepID=UPI0008A8E829|nr:hypothetical protein [Mycobacteroides chelonae]OHU23363.1 hypothetical protein BKG77_06745 [Mycobacteroides chelonae]